ncbi:unnamed protein product [marine sediment metagenome]|uniref:Uncharacterized protein n=1 Tax=marine sediment metagenome TaxID=412755 RepID=X1K939_9ZZZZ
MASFDDNLPKVRRCPNCLGPAKMTAWRPEPGLNPITREYRCSICHYEWYHTTKHPGKFPTQEA